MQMITTKYASCDKKQQAESFFWICWNYFIAVTPIVPHLARLWVILQQLRGTHLYCYLVVWVDKKSKVLLLIKVLRKVCMTSSPLIQGAQATKLLKLKQFRGSIGL